MSPALAGSRGVDGTEDQPRRARRDVGRQPGSDSVRSPDDDVGGRAEPVPLGGRGRVVVAQDDEAAPGTGERLASGVVPGRRGAGAEPVGGAAPLVPAVGRLCRDVPDGPAGAADPDREAAVAAPR